MPAGDLITADWQGELRGLLFGAGTAYEISPEGISGLFGVPKAKTADTDLDGQDGAYPAPDFMGVRTILIHFEVLGDSAADVANAFKLLAIAFEPEATANFNELHLQLPGWGHVKYFGRPRGLDDDPVNLKSGTLGGIGQFDALQPRAVTVA